MSRFSAGRVALVLVACGGAAALANCVDSSENPPPPAGLDSGLIDAHVDGVDSASGNHDAAPGVDGSSDASPVVDSGIDSSTEADAADAESTPDAADSAPPPDAAPVLDDAGCPVPTGITVSLQDAGIPTTGLVLWLRSDIGLETLNDVADGGVVCRWDDVSGKGQSFTPASTSPPTKVANALGAMPAMAFAAQQNVTRAGVIGIGATSARTFAVYAKTSDTTHRFEPVFQGVDGTPGTYFGIDANTFNTVGNREGVYVTNNSYDSDLATTTNARTHILSINSFAVGTALPAAVTYAVDGTVRTLSVAQANGNTVQDFSGANFTSVGYGAPGFTGGMIGEVLVYDREISAAERTMIEQHFAARF